MSTIKVRAKRTLKGVRETVADMNYAHRRVVEIKFGIPPEESPYSRGAREEIEELEALFDLETVEPEAKDPA